MGLITILIIALIVSVIFGGWQHSNYPGWSWSPVGIVLVILLILLLTGNLHV